MILAPSFDCFIAYMSGNFDNSPVDNSLPPYNPEENKIEGEVLDFSELHISAVEIGGVGDDYEPEEIADDKDDDGEGEEGDEERFTRGRSRSRSVHSNDDDGGAFVYHPGPAPENNNSDEEQGKSSGSHATTMERTGPLQHREVIALQKVEYWDAIVSILYFDQCCCL